MSGLPPTTLRLARLPISIEPSDASRPKKRAGLIVLVWRLRRDVNPAFVSHFEFIRYTKAWDQPITPGDETIAMNIHVMNRLETHLIRQANFVKSLRAHM